ncbi:oxygenase MpaB family protein [Persicitalea jodogahamensis]|uniref:ER-bound oxygenase mpaB/mpaB'/Rubber oxygenase catalytic domain-containing protein n=1 Tax=Persicitalea jodogahamensis TaxID=402147 RepID=A0A8J3DB80_9BACT|nr:oxygenase MpaB family protein [Persicitalea jodogahamensis]GHB79265.1 hypothetical protein GCM10007390_36560 [Persicitalea jodogahamensis]
MRKDTITGRSFPADFLEPYRYVGDPAADLVIAAVADQGGHATVGPLMRFLTDYDDFDLTAQPDAVSEFINGRSAFPESIDKDQFKGGIAFFWKHYQLVSLLLGTYALPYCYAGANGARVLWISERIKNNTFQRLEETGAFVFGIMQERDWQNGSNFVRIAKIRLLHAAVRWFTLNSGRWETSWGHPVCQEDMAGTNLSFSFIILKGFRKLNMTISRQEEESYLYFWNIVGGMLGVVPELLPKNMLEAYRLDKGIADRQFESSEAGRGLTKALLRAIEKQITSPTMQSLPAAQMRFFLGEKIADILAVPEVAWEKGFLKLALQTPIFPTLMSLQKPASPVLEKYWR